MGHGVRVYEVADFQSSGFSYRARFQGLPDLAVPYLVVP